MSKPVPPLAELKVLRMLQVELNERTRRLSADLPGELGRSEGQLGEIEKLGEEQREIQEMSSKIVQGQKGG